MLTEEVATHKLTVSTSVMVRLLTPLKALIANNPIIPILDHFLFECDGATITATASDLQVYLSTEIPIDSTSEGFSLCVPAKLLMDLLAKLPEQPVSVLFSDDTMEVRTDNGHYILPIQGAVDYPSSTEATPGLSVQMPVDQLQHALYHTTFATASDELRPAMSSVCIESKLGLRFMASDGHRAVCVERPDAGLDNFKANLPRKAATLLTKLLAEATGEAEIEITPTTIIFRLNAYTLEARQTDAPFPDVAGLFQVNPIQLSIGKADLAHVLKRLLVLASKTTGLIRVDLEKANQMHLSVNNLDMERQGYEKLLCDYPGEKLSIGFNGSLLLDLVEHVDNAILTLSMSAPNRCVFITEPDTSAEVTVWSMVMPIMLT